MVAESSVVGSVTMIVDVDVVVVVLIRQAQFGETDWMENHFLSCLDSFS